MTYRTTPNSRPLGHSSAGPGLNCVFSGGVSRAFVSNVGVLEAIIEAGLSFDTFGGISAGSVIPLLATAGVPLGTMKALVLNEHFASLLSDNYTHFRKIRLAWRILNRRRYLQTLPTRGLYSTEALGKLVDGYVKVWPERYWTMAYSRDAQIVFTSRNVLKRTRDGAVSIIDDKPAPIGLAIRASCALPGFFDAVQYTANDGTTYDLFDGFVSWDGICPVTFVEGFFGVPKRSIIACDVGKYSKPNRLLGQGYGAVICPDPPFPAHHLKLTYAQRIAGIAAGYYAAKDALANGIWREEAGSTAPSQL